ncbi:terminase small subunit [Rhizobium sp. Pop5]|uniref:terminase small subunit n=1 Tax=Rhizobium sp. Pop5 TaxID=1223565 RepID=UPI0002838FFC|nr:terminase small subunit [Rhizobium sp. Pop5]EJZ17377.1 Phage terminase small subunit [Rhizobium sp. Pop5]
MAELTARQRLFVAEYLKDLNATQAAVRAGFSGKSKDTPVRLMANEAVRAEIERALGARLEKLEITAERVLAAIADIAFGDVRDVFDEEGALKAPSEWDDRTAAAVAGLELNTLAKARGDVVHVAKIKRADRLKALDMLARHHSLYHDRLEIKGLEALSERLARAKARRAGDGGAEG